MIKLFLPLIVGFCGIWYVLRYTQEKSARRAGILTVLFATVCFILYSYGVLGVGVSSLILNLFEKTGVVL